MSTPDLRPITAEGLAELQREHPELRIIDVRSPAEFESAHIRGSYNVPLPLLAEHADELGARLGPQAVLVCQSGVRAQQAHQRLAAAGIAHAYVLAGGVNAYESAGGDLVRGRTRWAMERQVRLTAGVLVVSGLLIAEFWLPAARFLALAIGVGLSVAALTNTCAMARMLSILPWNRTDSPVSVEHSIRTIPVPSGR